MPSMVSIDLAKEVKDIRGGCQALCPPDFCPVGKSGGWGVGL